MTVKTNINLFHREMNQLIDTMDAGARNAANELAAAMEQLAKEEIEGQRYWWPSSGKTRYYAKAEPGKPPKNRSGNLRRSIKSFKFREGFASYKVEVGPTMVYSRAVELGGEAAPRSWQGTSAMRGFPYMLPAWRKFKNSGLMKEIIARNVMR